jgi:hypothetical protein
MRQLHPWSRICLNLSQKDSSYPTHRHSPEFWEALGRAVATFGSLEETLGKAIFALTATTSYPENEIQAAYEAWLPKLERALSDPLGKLIDTFGKSLRDHCEATISNLDYLLSDLRKASEFRNVICHGSWRLPDENSFSIPHYVNHHQQVFLTPIDAQYLVQVQRGTAELIFSVMDCVTTMGYNFPGSDGPGKQIF